MAQSPFYRTALLGFNMVIGTRELKLRQGQGDIPVPIRISAPEQRDDDWACRFEIDWPDEMFTMDARGIDAVKRWSSR